MTRTILAGLALALGLSACASSPERTSSGGLVYALREVDVRPVLVGCSGYDPIFTQNAPGGARRYISVEVDFVVDAQGNVDPGSLAFRTNRPEAESAVLQAARGCAYKPALLNGEAVAVRAKRSFSIPYETVVPAKAPEDNLGRQSPIAPPRVMPGTSEPGQGSPR